MDKPSTTPSIKLKTIEKDKVTLDCVVSPSVAGNALKCLVVEAEEIKININEIFDLIRHDNNRNKNLLKKKCG